MRIADFGTKWVLTSRFERFASEVALDVHCMQCWINPTTGLHRAGQEKMFSLPESNLIACLITSHFIDCAVPLCTYERVSTLTALGL